MSIHITPSEKQLRFIAKALGFKVKTIKQLNAIELYDAEVAARYSHETSEDMGFPDELGARIIHSDTELRATGIIARLLQIEPRPMTNVKSVEKAITQLQKEKLPKNGANKNTQQRG